MRYRVILYCFLFFRIESYAAVFALICNIGCIYCFNMKEGFAFLPKKGNYGRAHI